MVFINNFTPITQCKSTHHIVARRYLLPIAIHDRPEDILNSFYRLETIISPLINPIQSLEHKWN